MQGLVLSELALTQPGQTVMSRGGRSRRRCVYIVTAVLLMGLLGILAFVAYRHSPPLILPDYRISDRTETGYYIVVPEDYNISGWIETAGPEAPWPPAPGHLWPNGTPPAAGPFRYVINEENKCPEGEEPPFLVLLIAVEAHQVDRRDAIRRTWGAESPRRGGGAPGVGPRVVRLFLLGVTEEEEDGAERSPRPLEEESLRHGDILQQDFVDAYLNLTAKTLMGLNWVARHCPRAAYVMKTDSDAFVNTEYLVHELLRWPRVKPRRNVFTGNVVKDARPYRDKDSKWYVSEEEYPSETYPDYCQGLGYVLSGDLAARIYGASLGAPRFPWEDVHVGMCLDRLRVPVSPPPSPFLFRYWAPSPYDSDGYSRLVAAHGVTPTEMLDIWRRLRPRGGPLPPERPRSPVMRWGTFSA